MPAYAYRWDMKRFLMLSVEAALLSVAALVWIWALTDRPDRAVNAAPAEALAALPVADTLRTAPTPAAVPEPIALARWFGELPPPVVRRPAAPVESEPQRADHVRVTGSLVIDGHRFISAVDSRVGRALLIGEHPEIADWILLEERADALVVNAEGTRLLIMRETP